MTVNATQSAHVLVVSREPSALSWLWAMGESNAWVLETAASGWEALERVQAETGLDLLLLEVPRGDTDGLHTLRWLRRVRPDLPIFLLSNSDDARERVEAIRLGAQEYLVHPLEEEHLQAAIRRHLGAREGGSGAESARDDIEQVSDDLFFVAASPAMRKLRSQADLLAQVASPVLVVGENGSGKETSARLIHKLSVRSGFPFLKVNCAALPGDLLESELFGYERDLLAGGLRAKPGKIELCDRGTLFLDNIAAIPLHVQSKLLHVLQDKQFSRFNGEARIGADVRIIAAADVNIDQLLAEKKLREDLYYRLGAFTVHVPPLRQRREEIPLLIGHFMNQLARHAGLPVRTVSPALLDACQTYPWPGNLRELESFVKRYLVTGDEELALANLETELSPVSSSSYVLEAPKQGTTRVIEIGEHEERASSLKSLVQSVKGETERNAITTALEQTGWNRKAAARLLKVSYRTLLYKIEQYRMSPPEYFPSVVSGNGTRGGGNGH